MNFNDYQADALRSKPVTERQSDAIALGAMGCAEEAGEVVALVRKAARDGTAMSCQEMLIELGDLLWNVTYTAQSAGFTLEEVAAANLAKQRARHPLAYERAPGR